MTELYLIRHAEAEGNVFRRLHGQYDSGVTPNGRRQIAALRQRFAPITIDAVYASDLTRTCITASALYEPKGLALHRDRRFREVSVGVWEDIPFGWLRKYEAERMQAFSHDPANWFIDGCERLPEYTARFLCALEEVSRAHDGQTVAIFSHGMVLRGVLQRLFAVEGHCENTGVTHLFYENGEYRLDYYNDASHISPEISTLGRQHWWRGDRKIDDLRYRDAEDGDGPLLRRLECPNAPRVRIALLGDEPVGVLALREAETGIGELEHLALLPQYRGQGLAVQLLGEAVSLFRAAGKTELRLCQAPETPEARRFFTAYCFRGTPCAISLLPEEIGR